MSIIEGSESRKAEESMLRRVLSHRAVLSRSVVEELERSDNWEWNPRLRSVMSTLRRPIGDELGVASAHMAADARNSAGARRGSTRIAIGVPQRGRRSRPAATASLHTYHPADTALPA